jgi:3-deoxy-7-phosphoheptulonate synthase
MMLESHLQAGSQPIPAELSQLKYGVSVTDACIDWATTADLLRRAAGELRPGLAARSG